MHRLLLALLALLLATSAAAETLAPSAPAEFADVQVELRQMCQKAALSEATIDTVFAGLHYLPVAVKSDANQPEKRIAFADYLERNLSASRLARAHTQWRNEMPAVARAAGRYGVEPQFLVALWTIESNCGKWIGTHRVFDALATMSLSPGKRGAFFKKEFVAAATILEREQLDLDVMRGSWAGAMGHTQFMPSTYLAYAQDGDGDGRADLWNSPADALASAGRYLQALGWKLGQSWAVAISLPPETRSEREVSAEELEAAGAELPLELTGSTGHLLQPDGEAGPIYYVGGNVKRLLKWNRSDFFALTVAHLAAALAENAPK